MIIILMGVSGCGKTTIGKLLAADLNIPYYEGDAFHPDSNVDKMSAGLPLSDKDRKSWLNTLALLIFKKIEKGEDGILACSALKKHYRDQLRVSPGEVRFIYLKGDYDLIYSRLQGRRNHYMPADLLRSQFNDLQEPEDAITVRIDQTPTEINSEIITQLSTTQT